MSRGGQREGAGRPAVKLKIGQHRSVDVRELTHRGLRKAGSWICTWQRSGSTRELATLQLEGGRDLVDLTTGRPATARVPIVSTGTRLYGEVLALRKTMSTQ
jgi:hypothetical protein